MQIPEHIGAAPFLEAADTDWEESGRSNSQGNCVHAAVVSEHAAFLMKISVVTAA
jgi:hypothetical protein